MGLRLTLERGGMRTPERTSDEIGCGGIDTSSPCLLLLGFFAATTSAPPFRSCNFKASATGMRIGDEGVRVQGLGGGEGEVWV